MCVWLKVTTRGLASGIFCETSGPCAASARTQEQLTLLASAGGWPRFSLPFPFRELSFSSRDGCAAGAWEDFRKRPGTEDSVSNGLQSSANWTVVNQSSSAWGSEG